MDAVIVGIVSAVSIIVVALINAFSSRKNARHVDLERLSDALETHIKQDAENQEKVNEQLERLSRHGALDHARGLCADFHNKSLPMEERVTYAQIYLDCGYNGVRKVQAEALIDRYKASLEGKNG